MNNPLVSIIVPCYNQAQYLSEALLSVLEQTYQGWECIIVNDGSPDNTEAVAQEWLEKDTRFKYIYKENGGLSSARNAGITIAEGEFILPLDADDRIGPNYLSLAVDEFKKDSELKVVYCKAEKFGDEVGEWILEPFTLKNLSLFNMIFCSAIFRKNEWIEVGGYDVSMIYGFEDWEFWISILKNGGNVCKIDNICFYYRTKKSSMFNTISAMQHKKLYDYVCTKHIEFYINLFGNYPSFYMEMEHLSVQQRNQLKSEKFVINLFCKTFFNFQLFAKHKIV
jgi:glycosyltransferase involved in cell wall biosynthesis